MRTCRAIPPAKFEACGAPATHLVIFSDGQEASMCLDCVVHMRELAATQTPPVRLHVERLAEVGA